MINTELQEENIQIDATQLRQGWRKVRFGDVVRNVDISERDPLAKGIDRYIGLDHIDPESLHIKRWGQIEDGTSFTRKFSAGQVLFGKRRAYQRKVALAEFDGICSGDILVFEAKDGLIPELLPFIVQSDGFYEHALSTSAGSLSPRTKWKDLAAYEFALPPKDEQRRIADILWAADNNLLKWLSVSSALIDARKTFLKDIFDNKKFQNNGWNLRSLEELAVIQTGLAKGKVYYGESVVSRPYLRVANVQDGYLDLSEIKRITIAEKDVERYLLKIGDVLLTEGGDYDKLGRGTIWQGQVEECLHQNHVFCVRPDTDKLLPEFLSLQTSSEYGKKYFLSCSKQTTNLASINSSQVKAFPVLLPSLEEQNFIVNSLSAIEIHMERINDYILKTHHLKKVLLKTLLTLQ